MNSRVERQPSARWGRSSLSVGLYMSSRTILALTAALAAGSNPGVPVMSTTFPGAPAAPARTGDVAIQEELDAARAAGSVAAYELFIDRHPGHPLQAVARAELERLKGGVPR